MKKFQFCYSLQRSILNLFSEEDEEETVLLVPRLVLERVTLSPNQNIRRQSFDRRQSMDRQSNEQQSLDRQITDRNSLDRQITDRKKSIDRKSVDRRKSIDPRKSLDSVGRRQAAEVRRSVEPLRVLQVQIYRALYLRNHSHYALQGGPQDLTCPVFKWWKEGWFPNGRVFKCHLKTGHF